MNDWINISIKQFIAPHTCWDLNSTMPVLAMLVTIFLVLVVVTLHRILDIVTTGALISGGQGHVLGGDLQARLGQVR